MDLTYYLRGLVIGFSIAAPVGPIGVLCIRRTLAEGRAAGLASGLGAATADALYGTVAAAGLTAVSGFLLAQAGWIRLGGGLFLLYLGARTLLARPVDARPTVGGPAPVGRRGLIDAYASTFLLTLTNPLTILSFAAVFAGLGLGAAPGEYGAALLLVLGVFSGSALWWLLLSSGVSRLRARLDVQGLVWVNRIAGLVILAFASAALLSAR